MSVYIHPYDEALHNGERQDVTIGVNRHAVAMLERDLAGSVPMQGTSGDALVEMARRQNRAYSFVHDIHMQMRPQFEQRMKTSVEEESALSQRSPEEVVGELRALLKSARSYLVDPAEGHDDGMLLADLIERIDASVEADSAEAERDKKGNAPSPSAPAAARVIVTLPDGYNGHTEQFNSEPVLRDGATVKLTCSAPGKEHLIRWIHEDDLRRAVQEQLTNARAWTYRDEKEGASLVSLDRLPPEQRRSWSTEMPMGEAPPELSAEAEPAPRPRMRM